MIYQQGCDEVALEVRGVVLFKNCKVEAVKTSQTAFRAQPQIATLGLSNGGHGALR